MKLVPFSCQGVVLCATLCVAVERAGMSQSLEKPASPSRADTSSPRGDNFPRFQVKSLEGWKVVDRFFFDRHGKVTAADGEVRLEAGRPGTAIAWQGAMPTQNYEVTLEAKRIAGSDFFCGLTFPIDKSYCTLILGGWGGGTTGLSNIDDFPAVENETTGFEEFQQDRWYKVRLRVTPQRIGVWLDQKQIVDVDPAERRFGIWWEQEPVCPFGIATWNTTAAVRKLKVECVK